MCDDCLHELHDPADRRYRYPFLNCTNCGPRFTIVRELPYDRPNTTLQGFAMCEACAAEYDDPRDRRFHAQPNACPDCGPRVWLTLPAEGAIAPPPGATTDAALARARELFAAGRIVAVKGVGGFHLACDASSDTAVKLLRKRKRRGDKPFAVMVRDLEAVRRFARVSDQDAALLAGRERPVVLLPRRAEAGSTLSVALAPGNPSIGVMLPYSPLHELLIGDVPLVMTSANRSDEPIVKDNGEALERLRDLADAFLFHDRPIEVVCDDSVVRTFDGRELPIRRSRGYAPFPIRSPVAGPPVLAVGGELKATLCLTRGETAFLSQHVGDMENLETLKAFERACAHMRRLVAVEPEVVACDRHPGYLSSDWALRYAEELGVPLVRVQHHHAHAASLMAENGLEPGARVLAFAFDGTGYGDDGAVWGGEVLDAGYRECRRLGHLKYVPLPGGDQAIRKPYRMALAHLHAAGLDWDEELAVVRDTSEEERRVLRRQLERDLNCVPTSSMGRLFDAVAALAGVERIASYEAEAAIELEGLAAEPPPPGGGYELGLEAGAPFLFDPGPAFARMTADVLGGIGVELLSARFHAGLADTLVRAARLVRDERGLDTVGLTGGVFQNVVLLSLATERLRAAGFRVLTHRLVPPNDGGIALGQAAVAAARAQLARGTSAAAR